MSLLSDSYASFVNLDSRTDRLDKMVESLARVGISATRTRGMLPTEYKGPPKRISAMLKRPQKGAIGCYFSQLAIIEEALRQGRHAFVMEDDLIFCSDFLKRVVIIEEFVSSHPWDVLWLAGTFHVNPPWWHTQDLGQDAELTDNPRIIRTYGAFCTHAYIVNRESIAKILPMLEEQLPDSIGIDYSFIQIQPKLFTYAFVPGCIIQYDNQSNIGHGMTIFSNFKKLGPYWYQDRMEDFDPTTFNWHEVKHKRK